MNIIRRGMTTICSDDLMVSSDFYITLFDFEVRYTSDWFIHLVARDQGLELGIITRNSALVPVEYQNVPSGFYITFVVDNADQLYELATSKHFEIVSPPEDTFYGQRRFLLKDPNGVLIDISSVI